MKKFTYAIALGGNWREYPPKNPPGDWHLCLSVEAKMRALSAGEFYRRGLTEKIIFSGGKTAGKNFESEAEAMWKYLHVKFPEIPKEKVILEEDSFNTQGNAKNVARILDGVKGVVALITTASHLPRALKIFAEYGISTQGFKTEELFQQHSLRRRKFAAKFLASRRVKFENFKERILRALLTIDPKGKFVGQVSKRIRHENS